MAEKRPPILVSNMCLLPFGKSGWGASIEHVVGAATSAGYDGISLMPTHAIRNQTRQAGPIPDEFARVFSLHQSFLGNQPTEVTSLKTAVKRVGDHVLGRYLPGATESIDYIKDMAPQAPYAAAGTFYPHSGQILTSDGTGLTKRASQPATSSFAALELEPDATPTEYLHAGARLGLTHLALDTYHVRGLRDPEAFWRDAVRQTDRVAEIHVSVGRTDMTNATGKTAQRTNDDLEGLLGGACRLRGTYLGAQLQEVKRAFAQTQLPPIVVEVPPQSLVMQGVSSITKAHRRICTTLVDTLYPAPSHQRVFTVD